MLVPYLCWFICHFYLIWVRLEDLPEHGWLGRTQESWGRSRIRNPDILGDFCLRGRISEGGKSGHLGLKMCSGRRRNPDSGVGIY